MATAQWGMAREETGSLLKLPPGPWWFAPIGLINSSFNLLKINMVIALQGRFSLANVCIYFLSIYPLY